VARAVPTPDQRHRFAQMRILSGTDHQQGTGAGEVIELPQLVLKAGEPLDYGGA